MPRSSYRKRGRIKRYRTKKINPQEYMTIAVVSKPGPRGGHTIASGPKRKKR